MITVKMNSDGSAVSSYDYMMWGKVITRQMDKYEVESLVLTPCPNNRKQPCGACLICKTKAAWRANQ